MPFEAGKSGNPGGRPRRDPEEMKKWFEASKGNLAILLDIRENAEKDTDRLRAIEIIEDRAFGKPVQQVEADVHDSRPTVDTSKLSQDQKAVLAALAVESIGG
jgi:hypothetical protein